MSARIARTVAVAAIFAVVPLKGEAQTRKPMPREVAAIRDCAKKYETNLDEAERQCLFNLVSTPCTDTPEGSSNVGTADCFRIEWKIWDDLLNENYQSLLAALDDDQARKAPRHAASLDCLSRHNLRILLRQNSRHDGLSNAGRLHRSRNHAAGIAAQILHWPMKIAR